MHGNEVALRIVLLAAAGILVALEKYVLHLPLLTFFAVAAAVLAAITVIAHVKLINPLQDVQEGDG